jgi:Family of unknown function (DUF6088)
VSSFVAIKLDIHTYPIHIHSMGRRPPRSGRFTIVIRRRIEAGGERLWRLQDFSDLPPSPVAKAFSRLTRQGIIQRLSKGIYYRARRTALGDSLPNPAAIQELVSRGNHVFPSGIAAANLLGFTTQTAARREVSTSALSLPRKLIGSDTIIHARRPEAWTSLSEADAALLDFLRRGGKASELSPQETVRRTVALFSEKGRFERLLGVADTEPPRVRAMMGAIGQQIGKKSAALTRLRRSLNPLSRFDFGVLVGLPSARAWQAKEPG